MPLDRRFYDWRDGITLNALAKEAGIELEGAPDRVVAGLSPASRAGEGDLCFIDGKDARAGRVADARCLCLTPRNLAATLPESPVYLRIDQPRRVFAKLAEAFAPLRAWPAGSEAVAADAVLEEGVLLSPGVVIGPGAVIGAHTRIGPGSVIGPGVQIGRRGDVGAHVSIRCALIGDHVRIASGTRIGEAGFGTLAGADGAEDMPQFGRVIIQDHVSIGANCCIDRGALDDTVIGERTKIDNLCQIGHNVILGRSVLMAAFAGLSGTVRVGDGAMMGGRVGIADHVTIGAGAQLAADAAVMRDVPPGEVWGGSPARPMRQWMRETAWLQRQTRQRKGGE